MKAKNPKTKMEKVARTKWFLTTLFFVGSLNLLNSCSDSDAEVRRQNAMNVKVANVKEIESEITYSFSGQIISDEKTRLAFLVPGRIENVYVDEGEKIRAGQVLATLEPLDFQNDIDLQEARLLSAKDRFDRMQILYGKESVPESDFIQAKAGFQQAVALLNIANKKLQDTKLIAPTEGIVVKELSKTGSVTEPGMPILEYTPSDALIVSVSVPENEINAISVGDVLRAEIPALQKTIDVTVSSVIPSADLLSRTFTVKSIINGADGLLKDGMLATVTIVTAKKERLLTVPVHSVIMGPDNIPYLYKVDDTNGHALKTRVQIGRVLNNSIEVSSGVSLSDKIVVKGQHKLRDGSSIKVI